MAKIKSYIKHESGIPLGGIGAGTLEIRPDGYLHDWQIFNMGKWATLQADCSNTNKEPDMLTDAFPFFIRTEQGNTQPIVRRLGLGLEQSEFRYLMYSWLKNVEEIHFEGRCPVAEMKYIDKDLPISISSTFFSSFIPHDSRTSGTPGFYTIFKIKNTSNHHVNVSLLTKLKNPINWGSEERGLENSISHSENTTRLNMRTVKESCCQQTNGSLCLSVTGGDHSWIRGDYSQFFNNYVSYTPMGITEESFLFNFQKTGRLPDLGAGRSPSENLCMTDGEIDALPVTAMDDIIAELIKNSFAYSLWERISTIDEIYLQNKEGKAVFLKSIRDLLNKFDGNDRKKQTWGDGALCSSIILAPQEEKEICFILSWYFPNHYSTNGSLMGHMYENWFKDAEDVNIYMTENFESISKRTLLFAGNLYDTNLNPVLPDAWSSQLSTITKSTWWLKNGDFAVWEGVGCCGFHTTDVTYLGSFSILALFPELQKKQMEMGARFQREDGRVHHTFNPDFSSVDDEFDRVDMNLQFVLLICRDYLWTGDMDYVKRLWTAIVKAMDNIEKLDKDEDGLPDSDTERNTYDAWKFSGTPSYISSLWLSALLAGIRLAEDLREKACALKWKELLRKGKKSFERKLWNGEYYSLWVDNEQRDECCMTDQIDGEFFTNLIGLGHILPKQRIRQTIKSILKYNFSIESGLVNANYPDSAKPTLFSYHNVQADANWTGIEFAMASFMMEFNMFRQGLEVIKNIHKRYCRGGRIWNHPECGDHYYRAMSSWTLLLAATGFKVDVPMQIVTFTKAVSNGEIRAPWVSSTGWGSFIKTDNRFTMKCSSGRFAFKKLKINLQFDSAKVLLNGKALGLRSYDENGLVVLEFNTPLLINEGDTLEVLK